MRTCDYLMKNYVKATESAEGTTSTYPRNSPNQDVESSESLKHTASLQYEEERQILLRT